MTAIRMFVLTPGKCWSPQGLVFGEELEGLIFIETLTK